MRWKIHVDIYFPLLIVDGVVVVAANNFPLLFQLSIECFLHYGVWSFTRRKLYDKWLLSPYFQMNKSQAGGLIIQCSSNGSSSVQCGL